MYFSTKETKQWSCQVSVFIQETMPIPYLLNYVQELSALLKAEFSLKIYSCTNIP